MYNAVTAICRTFRQINSNVSTLCGVVEICPPEAFKALAAIYFHIQLFFDADGRELWGHLEQRCSRLLHRLVHDNRATIFYSWGESAVRKGVHIVYVVDYIRFFAKVVAAIFAVVVAVRLAVSVYRWLFKEITWRCEDRKWKAFVQQQRERAREQQQERLQAWKETMEREGRHFQALEQNLRIPQVSDAQEHELDVIRLLVTVEQFLQIYTQNAIAEQKRHASEFLRSESLEDHETLPRTSAILFLYISIFSAGHSEKFQLKTSE